MSYATPEEFTAQTTGLDLDDVPDTDDGIQALLDRAGQDIDQYLHIPIPPDPPLSGPIPGTRLDPAHLTAWEANSLMRATIAQACYRLIIGEQDLLEGPPHTVVAGNVTFSREAPALVCAVALVALAGLPTLWRNSSGTVPPPPAPLAA